MSNELHPNYVGLIEEFCTKMGFSSRSPSFEWETLSLVTPLFRVTLSLPDLPNDENGNPVTETATASNKKTAKSLVCEGMYHRLESLGYTVDAALKTCRSLCSSYPKKKKEDYDDTKGKFAQLLSHLEERGAKVNQVKEHDSGEDAQAIHPRYSCLITVTLQSGRVSAAIGMGSSPKTAMDTAARNLLRLMPAPADELCWVHG